MEITLLQQPSQLRPFFFFLFSTSADLIGAHAGLSPPRGPVARVRILLCNTKYLKYKRSRKYDLRHLNICDREILFGLSGNTNGHLDRCLEMIIKRFPCLSSSLLLCTEAAASPRREGGAGWGRVWSSLLSRRRGFSKGCHKNDGLVRRAAVQNKIDGLGRATVRNH